jgi:hypothetical protein
MKRYSRVLVVSINAWKDSSGINTIINLFKNWDSDNLAHIYTRSEKPSTKCCNKFFQISELSLIKKIVDFRKKVGERVFNESNGNAPVNSEKNIINITKQLSFWVFSFVREFIWLAVPYNKTSMKDFIDEFDPEVVFVPIYPVIYMNRLQLQIIKKCRTKTVAFIGDDNYSYNTGSYNPLFYVYRFILRIYVRKIITECDDVFVMVPKMKEEYDREFSINSIILTKGMDYTNNKFNVPKIKDPIRIVYTGKLIYGRYKSLITLASAIHKINRRNTKVQLFIYSSDKLSTKVQNKLNIPNSSFLMGGVPFSQIPSILEEADVLLFAESLDKQYKHLARLSFSTKLTDYMYAGKCIFAIGDESIAPIEYFETNQSALIATNYSEIYSTLEKLVDNPNMIHDFAKRAYDCGVNNHNCNVIDKILLDTINNKL